MRNYTFRILLIFVFIVLLVCQVHSWDFELASKIDISEIIEQPSALSVNNLSEIFISDIAENRIVKLDEKGDVIEEIGGFGWGEGEFNFPIDLSCLGLNVYVADLYNHRIVRLNRKLHWLSEMKLDDDFFISALWVNQYKTIFFLSKHKRALFIIQPDDEIYEFPLENEISDRTSIFGENSEGGIYLFDSISREVLKFSRFGNYEGRVHLRIPEDVVFITNLNRSFFVIYENPFRIELFSAEGKRIFEEKLDIKGKILDCVINSGFLYVLTDISVDIIKINQD
ncbi:hypothetical protein JXI42_14005 [bacterium]|nr:hypothetical protein [bacterium]